jgi:hypothetical protein
MSLGIFSFDLAALINSLSNFIEAPATQNPPVIEETTLEQVAEVLQNTTDSIDAKLDDVLMAAALSSTITSVIAAAETSKKESPSEKPAAQTVQVPTSTLDEETRREIERLIKLLQTSVTHNYRSSDIIDEAVSLNRVANFPRREPQQQRENREKKNENVEQERKRETQKLEMLRDQLKKAMLKNNAGV